MTMSFLERDIQIYRENIFNFGNKIGITSFFPYLFLLIKLDTRVEI